MRDTIIAIILAILGLIVLGQIEGGVNSASLVGPLLLGAAVYIGLRRFVKNG